MAGLSQKIDYPLNPNPHIDGIDPNLGREPSLRKLQVHRERDRLVLLLDVYSKARADAIPNTWEELEDQFGEGIWGSPQEWELLKRRYTFIGIRGVISDAKEGAIKGTLILVPIHPMLDSNSESGRYTIWRIDDGRIVPRWFTEAELKRFSSWNELAAKLDAAAAALAAKTLLIIESTPAPQPTSVRPASPTPDASKIPSVETRVATIEREQPVLLWLAGIAGLTALVLFFVKRSR